MVAGGRNISCESGGFVYAGYAIKCIISENVVIRLDIFGEVWRWFGQTQKYEILTFRVLE